MTELGKRRRDRLSRARLYLVCDAGFGAGGVRAALEGGADIVQLREKDADDRAVLAAAAGARLPCFAIGGLNAGNLGPVLAAGARRIVVVRAITEAADPEAAARRLRATLDAATEAGVGAA